MFRSSSLGTLTGAPSCRLQYGRRAAGTPGPPAAQAGGGASV